MKAFTRTVAALSMACVLPVSVQAQKQEPPRPGEPRPFSVPEARTFELDNGMQVTLVPFGTVPKVAIQLAVAAGGISEGSDEVWLANLTGDLMREGTTSRTGEEISIATASMGGSLNVGAGADETTVSGEVLSEFGPQLVRLIADVAIHPSFPESELERLKANRLRNLAIAKSQQQPLAQEKFHAVLFPDHPYGRIFPSEEMLQGYTVQQIRDFHATNFGARRAHLFIAGVYDEATMEAAIRAAFSDWAPGQPAQRTPVTPHTERRIHIIDRPGAVQSTVFIGLPVVDPSHADYIALQVTNALLGGSFSSRITSNIREDKGYTYSPGSFISTRHRNAYWVEAADITTAVTGAAIGEIFAEIERLQAEPPPADELHGIQNYLAGSFVLGVSSRGGLIGSLRTSALHGLAEDHLSTYVQRVHAVTPADVQRMAGTYLQDDRMTIVIVGDRQAIEEQLRPIAPIVTG